MMPGTVHVLFYKTFLMVVQAQYRIYGIYKVQQPKSIEHKQKQWCHQGPEGFMINSVDFTLCPHTGIALDSILCYSMFKL